MNNGYMGKFLYVDLTKRQTKTVDIPDWLIERYVGGKGFGVKLLYDLLPPGTDPFSPENPVMFMTGPLTGTSAPAMRACIVTKSPLTGTFLDSYFGGHFGPEIKYAGYDGLIITGKADKPVYLWIDDDHTEIRSAEEIWGKDTLEANEALKKIHDDPSIKAATIGQAGENLCRFALVSCEYNRQAGRGGAGAVMGSKNLKAIAIRGTRPVKVADPEAFRQAVRKSEEEIRESEGCKALTEAGTAYAVDFFNEIGTLPYKNFYDSVYEKAPELSDVGQSKHIWLSSAACLGCPIRCSKMGAVRTGAYAHFITDIVEYESAGLIGANLDISDVRAVAHLVKLCDRYGLDSMSTGGVIGFAIEAAQKGLIDSPENMEMEFGRSDTAEALIEAIVFRKGKLGETLAEGVKRAAEKIGQKSSDFAVHVKGLESPAIPPRGAPGMGLALMTADRGGCHQRGLAVIYEIGGEPWQGGKLEPLGLERKAELVVELQNYSAGTDVLVKCDFGSFGVSPQSYADMFSAATGRNIDAAFLDETGERIWNMTRLFNLREGIDPKEDRLPRRFVEEPLPSGPQKGHRITEEDMDYLRGDYYRLRGWNENGYPTKETLSRLRLDGDDIISF